MTLSLVRVDCRLVHGQVLEAWVPYVRSNCILVADDGLAENVLRKTIMSLSIPPNITFEVDTVNLLVERLLGNSWHHQRVLLLFPDFRSARQAYLLGLHYSCLNIGNIHFEQGNHRITPSVSLSREDLSILLELHDFGVRLDIRAIPADKSLSLGKIVSRAQDPTLK